MLISTVQSKRASSFDRPAMCYAGLAIVAGDAQ